MGPKRLSKFMIDLNFIILSLGVLITSVNGQDNCSIGTDVGEQTDSRQRMFYLNTQNPSPCDGTISSFNYCNYHPDTFAFTFRATFAVYRPMSDGFYQVVSTVFTVGGSGNELNLGQFSFGDFRFENDFGCGQTEANVTVQAGDIIGACIYDRSSGAQLDIIGSSQSTANYLMTTSSDGCADDSIPSSVSGLTQADSLVLHVYADIVPNPQTDPPTQSTTSEVTTMGTIATTSTDVILNVTEPPLNTSTVSVDSTSTVVNEETKTQTVVEVTSIKSSFEITSSLSSTTTFYTSIAPVVTSTPIEDIESTSTVVNEETKTPTVVEVTSVKSSFEITSSLSSTTTFYTSIAPVVTSTPIEDIESTSTVVNEETKTPTVVEVESTTIEISSTETTKPTSVVNEKTSSDDVVLPTSVDILLNQPVLESTKSVLNKRTTEVNIVASNTPIAARPADTQGGISVTTAVVVSVVLVIAFILAFVVVLVIIITQKRHKHFTRALNIQQPFEPSEGIMNVLYSNYADNNQVQLYDEIGPGMNKDQKEHQKTLEHMYESGNSLEFSNSGQAVYDNTYAEIGPSGEVQGETNQYYSSPLNTASVRFSHLLEKNRREDIYDYASPYEVPASGEREIYLQLKSWGTRGIPRNEIDAVAHLGSGQFGSVERGVWKRDGIATVDVAMKSLNKGSLAEDKIKFLQEAAIMAQFRHSNVILLHGVVISEESMLLVVELATKGDLRKFLLSMRPDLDKVNVGNIQNILLRFSQQVALGMQYLSGKGFIHRDLAARNVLISSDDICKVADFGMSRELSDQTYYISHGGKIPVKWTAPEALHYKKYSTASDVWAYGCLLYEIWSIGHKPFEKITNNEVIQKVNSGYRLTPSPGCPLPLYELMIQCWHPETAHRPCFRDIVLTLVNSKKKVLNIPVEDSSTHPQAGMLGAPLEAGENMYTDLQQRYLN